MSEVKNNNWWHLFVKRCLDFESQEDLLAFFDICFTLAEKEEFSKRYQIILELLKGDKSQRDIASELHVSVANVSRGSNTLKITKAEIKDKLLANKK